MTAAGFEPTIPASERPKTPALERAAIVIKAYEIYSLFSSSLCNFLGPLLFSCLFIKFRTRMAANDITVLEYTYTLVNEKLKAKMASVFQEK